MKSVYIKFACLGFIIALSSCSKSFLELNPPAAIVESNFYKDETEATQAMAGVYTVLQWGQWYGFHAPLCWSEAASDDAYSGGGSQSDGVGIKGIDQFRNVTVGDQTYRGLWATYYAGIARANVYLSKVNGVKASEAFKKMTTAEAKFLRAYFYFDLVRWYENVPLITAPQDNPDEYSQPQATPKAVFDQIAKDLEEAAAGLPKTSMKANSGRATYWSAKALLARVFLFYNGVYNDNLNAGNVVIDKQKAREYLEDVINNGGFQLIGDYNNIFRKAYELGTESVWEIVFSDKNPAPNVDNQRAGEGNFSVHMFAPRGINDATYSPGWSYSTITQALYASFENNDIRRDATVLYGRNFSPITKSWQYTGYFNKKYSTHIEYKTSTGNVDANWGNNIRSIRYSDVLLMASELWLGTDQAKADGYLKQVRDRVNLPVITATEENLRRERRVELGGEGVRYWDLLRYGLPYAKTMIDASSLRGPEYDGDQMRFTMDWDISKRGRLPIPQVEIDISNNMLKQNKGY